MSKRSFSTPEGEDSPMLKLTVAMLAIAVAGTPNADEFPSLRVDASSNAAFERSLTAFKDELSPEQRHAFGEALTDIWLAGTQAAETSRGKYRTADYYRQIHGLSYEEIVNFTTGETARRQTELRRQAAAAPSRSAAAPPSAAPWHPRSPWEGVPPPPPTWQPRGGTDLFGSGQK
jgi:hypothetical protein